MASAPLLLLLFSGVCHGLVETCEELQTAFELTKTQDVEIEVHPHANIECATFTTMSMDSNTLTVKSSEDLTELVGNSDLYEIRFEVTNGAKLFWETNVVFNGRTDEHELNGGAVFVGEDSTVRFWNDVELSGFSITSGSDTIAAGYDNVSGGCVYTDGYFRVDGKATFSNCLIVAGDEGGDDTAPRNGGALYVGSKGSVLFNLELDMSNNDLYSSGDFAFSAADNGGGIYNAGKINTKGGAVFTSLKGGVGGAIYNAVDAQFKFRSFSRALFLNCDSRDDFGSALYNRGSFEFAGPVVFLDNDAPSIYVGADGETDMSSSRASFFESSSFSSAAAIVVAAGGGVDIDVSFGSFFTTTDPDCGTVYYEEDGTCLE